MGFLPSSVMETTNQVPSTVAFATGSFFGPAFPPWGASFRAGGWSAEALGKQSPAVRAISPTTRNPPATVFILDKAMAISPPFARGAAPGEIALADAACPAANRVAALSVDDTTRGGAPAEA